MSVRQPFGRHLARSLRHLSSGYVRRLLSEQRRAPLRSQLIHTGHRPCVSWLRGETRRRAA